MTTKTISGTYSAGYHLSATFNQVSITASGSVGGFGLVTSAFASVVNAGHLEASLGYSGLTLGSGGGYLENIRSGYIRGGAAKVASGAGAAGNAGGSGASLTVYARIFDDEGDIVGGAGGTGVAAKYGGAGGAGGAAARFHAGGYVSNVGLMLGGVGGSGGAGTSTRSGSGGDGGGGGDGVSMAAAGTVSNFSTIYGGAGGYAGLYGSHRDEGGYGGVGVFLASGGYLAQGYAGFVNGGFGGYGGVNGGGGEGAAAVLLGPTGSVVSFGTIVGGEGGLGGGGGGSGGVGVQLDNGGLRNYGAVSGGYGGAVVTGAGAGGGGNDGVFCVNDSTVVNYRTIRGGAGGSVGGGGGETGAGGAGVGISNGGTLFNYGTVIGGVGGVGGSYGGAGDGVSVNGSVPVTITNGSSQDAQAFIGEATTAAGGYGIGVSVGSVVTVTNFGTLSGGYAVLFSDIETKGRNPDTLIVEAGSTFVGTNFGGGGNLVLASGVGTVSTSTSEIVVSGSMAPTTFGDFASLEIGAAASFTLAAGSDVPALTSSGEAGVLIDAGSATIAATLGVEGTIDVSGKLGGAKNSSLIIDGGTANFTSGASLSAPTVDVSGATQVNMEASLTFAHTWDQTGGTLSVDNGDTFTLKGFGSTFSGLLTGSGGGGTIAFALASPGTETLNGVTISGLTVDISGASLVVGAAGATIASTGTVRFQGASAGSFGGADTLTNAGLIETTSSAGTSIIDAIVNTGVLYADKGNLTLDGAVTGAGSAKITAATLDFASGFTGNVAFAGGSGQLELAQSQSFTGTITGFSKTGGTTLDLGDIGFVGSGEATYSGTKSGGVLTVTDGTHTARISLKGNYLTSTFIASSDGGGVLITDPAGGGGAAPPPPHAFIAAMAGLGPCPDAGMASHAMTGRSDFAATLVTPRVAIA